MGEGFQFIDIILLAMIAGFIALRLRSVLGRREHDDHPTVTEPMGRTSYDRNAQEQAPRSDTVVRLESDPELRRAYREIRRVDPDFDADNFLEGAQSVYPVILEAFWKGDRETLKNFLSDEVFAQFGSAIKAREEADQEVEGRVVDFSDIRIAEAAVEGTLVEITVRFEAEIVSVTKDAEGKVVEGNVSDTVTVTDLWTFERDAESDDPNWTLIATRTE